MQTGFYGKDIAIHMHYNRDKLALRKLLYSDLLIENKQLKERNAALQEELDTVDHYLKFNLEGYTPQEIMVDLHDTR